MIIFYARIRRWENKILTPLLTIGNSIWIPHEFVRDVSSSQLFLPHHEIECRRATVRLYRWRETAALVVLLVLQLDWRSLLTHHFSCACV